MALLQQVRKREVELELKSAKHEADLRTVTSEETLQLQQDIHQLNGKLSVVQYKRETLERDLEGERSRNLELSHRIRDLSENNAELRQQLQQLQQQLQTNYYQTDGDTALVINMQTSNDPHGKARLQLNPQVRAQSEWLAREQRKLARAKEQYARDIRQLQRQAESSLAQVRHGWLASSPPLLLLTNECIIYISCPSQSIDLQQQNPRCVRRRVHPYPVLSRPVLSCPMTSSYLG